MAARGRLQDQFAALERAMRDWELVDSDRFSFDDSDHFEEDSLCSWISEPESLCNNWRGWKKSIFATPNTTGSNAPISSAAGPSGCASLGNAALNKDGGNTLTGRRCIENAQTPLPPHLNLVELSAKVVASHIPFEMVERFYPPVPEQLQLRIAFWSFPEHEEDIRLYSCLANGSAEEFQKGERLFRSDSVADILQIGFHLSATVKPNMREAHKVAVTFDRRRVTSCTCTCNASTNWCGHVVSVCLGRIFQSKDVMLRAPVSESLSRLHRDQLQKFAQYLISELPQQILPTAQRLLDELLSSQRSAINTLRGAPDPTAGASANEQTSWFLDEKTLHGNIHKILIKFCVPAPIVFSDVNYLSSAAPPASAEWSSLLRPLRGREPEGMWNLLSIVREMFRREDRNAIPLLEIITEECLNCDQILVWWFNTKVALHNGNAGHGTKHHSVNSNAHACQHAGSSLCDEIVLLWRLAALNPGLSPDERCILHSQFKEWHLKIIDKVSKSRNASIGSKHGSNSFKNDIEIFPGFRPSIEACYLTWEDYPIQGVTYSNSNHLYQTPFMCFRHSDGHSRSGETGMIHSSHAILNNPAGEHHLLHSSATISSIPRPSSTKRPRSVDFSSDKNVGGKKVSSPQDGETNTSTSHNDAVAGTSAASMSAQPSTSKASAKANSKDLKKCDHLVGDTQGIPTSSEVIVAYPSMPLSASGLKVKEDSFSASDRSQSFDDDVNLSCSTYKRRTSSGDFGRQEANSLNCEATVVVVDQCRVVTDGTRSSVSSEGFCEPDLEVDLESLDLSEESAIQCSESLGKASIPVLGEKSSAIDYPEADVEDSDSSLSVPTGANNKVASKLESSDSQQSGDEYQQLYYYDTKAATNSVKRAGGKVDGNTDGGNRKDALGFSHTVCSVKLAEDPWELLFARAEGLHAHGHSQEACILGVKLAGELLANPPNLSLECLPAAPTGKGKKRKVNPATHQVSCLASATLAKCGFLCTVLAENADFYYLAFQVGMFGLELCRPPASTKPLEVKLANQEAELAQLLKRICIGSKELEMIRSKAASLRDGKFKSRGDALLPLVLANFIFDALVMPLNREGRCALQQGVFHLSTDEQLGFEAAVAALGLKANISEADHPLLCEGTRRQRGDLALTMLLHYKDDADKLARIMDKLLDREIHQLCKTPLPAAYYSNNPPTTPLLGAGLQGVARSEEKEGVAVTGALGSANLQSSNDVVASGPSSETPAKVESVVDVNQPNDVQLNAIASSTDGVPTKTNTQSFEGTSTSLTAPVSNGHSVASEIVIGHEPTEASTSSASLSSAGQPTASAGSNGAAISSGNSNGTTHATSITTTATKPTREPVRYKGKRNYPILPNQPSEAGAHFMFELAKVVLGKAGGSSNQSLFTQPSTNQNPRGPHRALHMCAFHMGLYALGLHNAVSPNWLSRTYSSNVSWITGQAMEIGAPAIAFLIDTWDAHLTPPEAVTIADRASRGDQNMVRAAAELALSCLPYAHALNPNEIHRAILQCKEQSDGMLEKACLTVENAAKGGGVYPEVLFDVARQWYSLYQKHLPLDVDVMNEEMHHHESLLSGLDPGMEPMPGQMHGSNVHLINQGSLQPSAMAPINPQNINLMPSSSNSLEVIGLASAPPVVPHSAVYPMPSPQVPLTSMPPYGSASYGHVPFLPPGYSHLPGNYMYGQALLYQATGNPNNGPAGVVTTTATFYNQQTQPHNGYNNMPPMHQQPMHNMVPGGPALQYYPPVPMNGVPHGHLRPGSGFYPVMTLHGNHGGHMQSNNSPATASMAAHQSAHTHTVSTLTSQTHVVAIPTSGGPSVNSQQQLVMTAAANMAHGHSNQGAAMAHNMGMPGHTLRTPPGPSQVNYQPPLNPHQLASGYHSSVVTSKAKPGMIAVNGALLQNAGDVSMSNQANGRAAYFQRDIGHSPVNAGPSSASGQASALKMKYLLAAYRVGMLAMETLARRVHDDRPAAKFARNPPYGEDVKWLLGISRKLGPQYLQQFCVCAVSSIANPFVLHEIILDASLIHQGRSNNLTWVYQNPRSPLYPLVQKCQQMYFQCLHQKLYHITISDYEDFVNIVCTARQAFNLTPDGVSQFKEWLQNLRKSKAYKKELWSQITTALQANQK